MMQRLVFVGAPVSKRAESRRNLRHRFLSRGVRERESAGFLLGSCFNSGDSFAARGPSFSRSVLHFLVLRRGVGRARARVFPRRLAKNCPETALPGSRPSGTGCAFSHTALSFGPSRRPSTPPEKGSEDRRWSRSRADQKSPPFSRFSPGDRVAPRTRPVVTRLFSRLTKHHALLEASREVLINDRAPSVDGSSFFRKKRGTTIK